MTEIEYQTGKKIAEEWLRQIGPEIAIRAAYLEDTVAGTWAASLLPSTMARWMREAAMQQLALHPTEMALDNFVTISPQWRQLKDPQFQKKLRARARWPDRKEFYEQFSKFTKDNRSWSLLHPFDELNAEEMREAIQAATTANEKGLRQLTKRERWLLLRAEQFGYFEKLLEGAER
jgi:hypothetical protein